MWDLIINIFVTLLTFFYSLTGNIVLSIAVFTILVRMLMFPLTIQQQKSSRAMQAIQPKMQDIQEKYKNDREKLAQEQMKLYQEHGVNPVGGCLPLFIQFPIFIGLYQAIIFALAATPLQLIDISGRFLMPTLATEIPLNNIWLGMDLTLPPTANPFYALALPALVVVTTWAQSKLTMPSQPPQAGSDERMNQAAQMTKSMTTIMPLMFGFFSLSFSVGISIYFIVSNLVGALQFAFLSRQRKAEEARQAEIEAQEKAEKKKSKKKKKETAS